MKLKYFVFCDEATKTMHGKPVLFGVFDVMGVVGPIKEEGIIHPKMVLAFEVGDVDLSVQHEVKVEMTHEDSKEVLLSHVFTSKGNEVGDRINGFIELAMFKIKKLGKYNTDLFLNGVKIGTTTLSVVKADVAK